MQPMCSKSMHRLNNKENEPMGKQSGKTIKSGRNRKKEQMWVHRGKPLIRRDKTLLSAGVHLQHYQLYLNILRNACLARCLLVSMKHFRNTNMISERGTMLKNGKLQWMKVKYLGFVNWFVKGIWLSQS